ncbi:MAG: MinD/ParA family protein [Syntrophaceticus sp.]
MDDQAAKLRLLANNLHKKIHSQVIDSTSGCQVLAVTSGKGGVGKTNIALGISLALAKAKYRVVLWDADLGLANVDVVLGLVPKYNLYHVFKGEKTLQEIMIQGPEGLCIIPGGSGIEELANIEPFLLNKILQDVALLDKKMDYLIIDTGAGISRQVIAVILAASKILLVTTPEATALTDAYGLIKVLRGRLDGDIKLIINMAKNKDESEAAAQKLVRVTRQFLNLKIDFVGWIPFDHTVQDAIRNNQSYLLASPRSPAALSTLRIATSLGRIQKENTSGIQKFIGQVVSFLKGEQT